MAAFITCTVTTDKSSTDLSIICSDDLYIISILGNPSHRPMGKNFPKSKYENVKNKQIQIIIFAPAGPKILDLFDSEHPYLESRKS